MEEGREEGWIIKEEKNKGEDTEEEEEDTSDSNGEEEEEKAGERPPAAQPAHHNQPTQPNKQTNSRQLLICGRARESCREHHHDETGARTTPKYLNRIIHSYTPLQ